jgi:hypothetical protein
LELLKLDDQGEPVDILASSAESVGAFRLRKLSKVVQ